MSEFEEADVFEMVVRTTALFTDGEMITGGRGQRSVEVHAGEARRDGVNVDHVAMQGVYDLLVESLGEMARHYQSIPTHVTVEIDARAKPFVDIEKVERRFERADTSEAGVTHDFAFVDFDSTEMVAIDIE